MNLLPFSVRSHYLDFRLVFIDSFIERARGTREGGSKGFLVYSPLGTRVCEFFSVPLLRVMLRVVIQPENGVMGLCMHGSFEVNYYVILLVCNHGC